MGMMDSCTLVNMSQFELLNPQLVHLSRCHLNHSHSELFTAGQSWTGPSGSVNDERVEPYLHGVTYMASFVLKRFISLRPLVRILSDPC